MLPATPILPGAHELPPLPYSYDALEPVIDEETMRIHHDRLHKAYVENLNKAELAMAKLREEGDFQFVSYWGNQLAFNGAGHTLHSILWAIMTRPDTGGSPGEYLLSHINWYFGGLEKLKAEFTNVANKVQGSGWAILGYSTAFRHLEVLPCEKHQDMTQWGVIPILVLDVWEHAYFRQYENKRQEYTKGFWRLINWPEVDRRLILAARGVLPLTKTEEGDIET